MIFTLNISILRHNTEKKRKEKETQKAARHLKMEKGLNKQYKHWISTIIWFCHPVT